MDILGIKKFTTDFGKNGNSAKIGKDFIPQLYKSCNGASMHHHFFLK